MTDVVSSGIYFLQDGLIEMSIMPPLEPRPKPKYEYHPLLVLSEGSYFGEISYIF